jgi:protein SCO1/2
MTDSMALLQKEFIKDDAILLVSHTVTPERDSVSVLADYGKKKNIQYKNWKLLNRTKEESYNLGIKFYFVKEDLGENKDALIFLHTEDFVLIDKSSMIRGIYNSLDSKSMATLAEDIKVLENE